MPRKNELQPDSIGYRIRQLREDMDLSQDALARKIRSSKDIVSRIESGKQNVYVAQLQEIAAALNTSLYYLATGIHPENSNIADELDLTDYSITILKEINQRTKAYNMNSQEGIYQNPFRIVIDMLCHYQDFTEKLFHYLTSNFANLVRRNDNSDYDFIAVKELVTLSREDIKRIKRLEILDDLKQIYDDMEKERNRLHDEQVKWWKQQNDSVINEVIKEASERNPDYDIRLEDETSQDSEETLMIKKLISLVRKNMEENENGQS